MPTFPRAPVTFLRHRSFFDKLGLDSASSLLLRQSIWLSVSPGNVDTIHFLCHALKSLLTLYRGIVLLEEFLKRMRKLLSCRRNVQMSINCLPAQVLQGGQDTGEWFEELQRDFLPTGVNVVSIPTAGVPFTLRHVVMDQLEDAVKVGNRLNVFRVCLQVERSCIALDAQVFGARRRLDAEGEQVSVVGAVPDEERAGGLGHQHGVRLLPCDGAPVEAALLELLERGENHLVLRLGGEHLITVRQPHVGVQGAAAHCGVKLAERYHGAVPTQ